MFDPNGLLTPAQAARRLQVSVESVRSWLRNGRLKCITTPLGRLILASEVERLIAERQQREGRRGDVTTTVERTEG